MKINPEDKIHSRLKSTKGELVRYLEDDTPTFSFMKTKIENLVNLIWLQKKDAELGRRIIVDVLYDCTIKKGINMNDIIKNANYRRS